MAVQLVLCLQHLPFFMSQLNRSSFLPLQCKHCPCPARSFCSFLWKLKRGKHLLDSGSCFLPWSLELYQGAGLHFLVTCSIRNGGLCSAFCGVGPFGAPKAEEFV